MEHWKGKHITIVSKRLLLTPLTKSDAEEVLNWINNGEIVKNFQFFTGKISINDELAYIAKMRNSQTDMLLGVITGEENDLMGSIGLHEIDFHNYTARLGIIIGKKDHWNQGYAQEAIRALASWAFSKMLLNKIYLNVFVTNERGIRLYTEVGFQTEGTLMEEYKIRGEYVNMFRMAILRRNWKGEKE